jgi:hypothetical protein
VSEWLLAAVSAAYLGTAVDLAMRGNYGMALAFICYGLANVGLIWSIR